jgi:hypothetical protein
MNGRTVLVLGAVGLGLYLLRKETGVVTSMMGDLTLIPPDVAAPTAADLQAKLVAGAQAVEDISSSVIQLPPLQYAGKIALGPA